MSLNSALLRKSHEFNDIIGRIPDFRPGVILDVGANVGENAIAYTTIFPEAVIHAFEPVHQTFDALQANVAPYPNVRIHPLALSNQEGEVRMWTSGTSPGAFIIRDPKKHYKNEIVTRTRRGDDVVAELGLDRISYIKIDAEGHDLEVLEGFGETLRRADFVQVEAGMNPHNRTHVPFRTLEDHLRGHGFHLFRFYEQSFEFFHGGHPLMRRSNPVFINGDRLDLGAFG